MWDAAKVNKDIPIRKLDLSKNVIDDGGKNECGDFCKLLKELEDLNISESIKGEENQSLKHMMGVNANYLNKRIKRLDLSHNTCPGGLTNMRKLIN